MTYAVWLDTKEKKKCMFGKDEELRREPYFIEPGGWITTSAASDSGTGGETWYTYEYEYTPRLYND